MTEDVTVVMHDAEIDAVKADPRFGEVLMTTARSTIVPAARGLAPVRATGSRGGAASINASVTRESDGMVARVSWDDAHAYMRFPERGTRYISARRFLERAAEMFS